MDTEDLQQLDLQPVSSKNKEFWLISLPYGVQPELLANQKLYISTESTEQTLEDSSLCAVMQNEPSCASVPLLSKGKSKKIIFGDKFNGQIVIKRSVKLKGKDLSSLSSRKKEIAMPTGLKQRWKPFGWRTPPSLSLTSSLSETTVNATPKKKEKKKKKDKTKHTDLFINC